MTMPSMKDLDYASYEHRFGSDTFTRGRRYFDEGRVGYVTWNQQASTFSASVRGNRATPYSTSVSMAMQLGKLVNFDHGRCNCPVVFNCKHAVAVLLQAYQDSLDDTTCTPMHSEHWASILAPLLCDREIGNSRSRVHIGLRLRVEPPSLPGESVRVLARPVRADVKGAWTTTGISWHALPTTADRRIERQVDILRELHALDQVRTYGRAAHTFHNPPSDSIDLAETSGRLLWDLLTDLGDCGVPLVDAAAPQDTIPSPSDAHFEIDITGTNDLEVDTRITVDGVVIPAERRYFMGRDGSGIVFYDSNESGIDPLGQSFRLARLSKPVALPLRRLASTPVGIPVADRIPFAATYLPELRRGATIVSSDGSYTPPTFAGPELHIVIAHDGAGSLCVSARWRYYVDDTEFDYDAGSPQTEAPGRDASAEFGLLRAVHALLGRPHLQSTFCPFVVSGTAAALFVAQALPPLDDYDNVHVDIVGEIPDFRDVSDDVHISLSTKDIPGENDWFDLGVVLTIDGSDVEFAAVIIAIARGDRHLLLSDGRFFSLDRPTFHRLRTLVDEARTLQDKPDGPLRISRYQASLWQELAEIGEVSRQAAAWREQVGALTAEGAIATQRAPVDFGAELRPYQHDGFSWLYFLWQHSLGGILADDMGLGKTMQTLAMIAKAKESGTLTSPFVIVAPTSVVHNWAREAAQFAPSLTVATVLGTRARRPTSIAEVASSADIVVTSYTVLRLDFDEFDAATWSGLVLDEAQYVKNHKSKSYQCVRRLSAPFKLAITGTPMENNIMELWALLSVTAPGLFPSAAKFTDAYRHPIEKSGDADKLATLRRRIRPWVLRRSKENVAQDLPAKQEQVVEVQLDPRHRRIYETRLARERQKILGLLTDFDRNRVVILRSLTILRQLSLDVALVEPDHDDIPSAKIEELVAQLTEVIRGGHRALVFSQFTKFLGKIRDRLEAEGISLAYLDGATRNREEAVEQFRSGGATVFLISLKAGGVGLTLTEADYCFVLDPWWNPATEAQAVDRAHRIGQTRTVFVHRYIARGTIEEKVMELKARKAELFTSVMDEGGTFSGGLTVEDIRALLE
ncbi:hypothetical protein A2J03_27660 [Rhodococcus sp. EPR-157]|uniref:DEAD/DEAH box helicase n=1 Tax=Rhodococcus sp. EPR-157 TaxID=1813677 RepID=UPI0007BBEB8E|nr:DEAD/DEAH box helicase [Rhodococcus sp. EPR-157]KZF03879.1 hypothetical protein A2J03_27660 [Rhodococcus sp. EPR-157]